MKQKVLTIGAMVIIGIAGLFVFEHATSAQRPDRNTPAQSGNRPGGDRGNRGVERVNPMSIVDNSWIDLTFALKVDDETLVKARPVYQAARDKFQAKMKEVQASGDMRAARSQMQEFVIATGREFQVGLKEVLTEEQMKKLNALTEKRQTERANRMNRWRGGEDGRRGGGPGR